MESGGRQLTVLLHMHSEEMTDRELMAVIEGCEPWKVSRDLTDKDLTAIAGESK